MRQGFVVAIALALTLTLAVAVVCAAAAQPPSIYVFPDTSFVYGFVSSPNTPVTVKLTKPGGVVSTANSTSLATPNAKGLYTYTAVLPNIIAIGDQVETTASNATTAMTVPNLTARAQRATSSVTGQAPPNVSLKVTLEQASGAYAQTVTSTPAGSYSASFAGHTMLAGDWGNVYYTPTLSVNTVTVLIYRVPGLWLYSGSNRVDGFAAAGGLPVTLTWGDETIHTTSSHNSFGYGRFSALFTTGSLRPGDQLVMTAGSEPSVSATVQPLTVAINRTTKTISGLGPGPNVPVTVEFNDPQNTYVQVVNTAASAPYAYSASFPAVTMSPGDWARASVADPNGNVTFAYGRVPLTYAYKGTGHVFGYATSAGAPLTVTLKTSAGQVKGVAYPISNYDVYAWGEFAADLRHPTTGAPATIAVGDIVETQVGNGAPFAITVQPLDGQIEVANNRVRGTTTPNATVRAVLFHWVGTGYDNGTERIVQADGSGNYSASFAGLVTAQAGDYALVYRPDGQGGVTYALAPSTQPTLAITAYPTFVAPNASANIAWSVANGVHTTSTSVFWDIMSHAVDYAYPHETAVQSGGPGAYSTTLTSLPAGRVYFRVRAVVDGQELWSAEQAIQVGRNTYLPLVTRQ